jgi:hypothetical protein
MVLEAKTRASRAFSHHMTSQQVDSKKIALIDVEYFESYLLARWSVFKYPESSLLAHGPMKIFVLSEPRATSRQVDFAFKVSPRDTYVFGTPPNSRRSCTHGCLLVHPPTA